MIILDTNIISELMKKLPSANVIEWLDEQDISDVFITTISIAEISYGIEALPKGVRRNAIETAYNEAITTAFEHRILSFTEKAAHQYGKLMGRKKSLGKPMSVLDGQIAAIALSNNAQIATRNIRDFENCKLSLINPFETATLTS